MKTIERQEDAYFLKILGSHPFWRLRYGQKCGLYEFCMKFLISIPFDLLPPISATFCRWFQPFPMFNESRQSSSKLPRHVGPNNTVSGFLSRKKIHIVLFRKCKRSSSIPPLLLYKQTDPDPRNQQNTWVLFSTTNWKSPIHEYTPGMNVTEKPYKSLVRSKLDSLTWQKKSGLQILDPIDHGSVRLV